MAPRLPKEVVGAIEVAIQVAHKNGKSPDLDAIATIFHTTYKSVCQIRRRLVQFERTGVDNRKRPGPKKLQDKNEDEIALFVRNLVEARPGVSLLEISGCLYEEFDLKIAKSSVSRLMKSKGIALTRASKLDKRPRGAVIPLSSEIDEGRYVAASALSALTTVMGGTNYTSPYGSSGDHQNVVGFQPTSVPSPPVFSQDPYS